MMRLTGGPSMRGAAGDPAAVRIPRAGDVWARPGMSVTFRAELMPGRSAPERTFRVARVLGSLRVLVEGIAGEHTATEFDLRK